MTNNMTNWEHRHVNQVSADEADQVEWAAYLNGSSPYDGSQIDDIVSGQLADFQSGAESHAAEYSSAGNTPEHAIAAKLSQQARETMLVEQRREEVTASVKLEVQRRSGLLGDAYPFKINGGSLTFLGKDEPAWAAYVFFLELAVDPQRAARETFEKLVANALRNYLGTSSISECFGWKSAEEEDAPKRIKAKINAINNACGEWIWCPSDDFPDDPPPKLVKDLGLDVIAWIPSPDGRLGQVFLVAQCATGRTDWESKLKDVDWDRITNWVRPLPDRWSIRCFAIPYHVANRAYLQDVSLRGGMFFDRVRLTLLLRE